jgi:mitotic-spindle organizing protein 1
MRTPSPPWQNPVVSPLCTLVSHAAAAAGPTPHEGGDARRCVAPLLGRARSARALTRSLSRLCAVLFDISRLLQTGLDRETLSILVDLTESGVNPEALATVVKELRRESAELQAAQSAAQQNVGAGSGQQRTT